MTQRKLATLPERLQAVLSARGLTQRAAAQLLGTSQPRLSTILHGKHQPTRDWVADAAEVLGIAPADIDPRFDPDRLGRSHRTD
jgi:transcriptional regulator with XRE-family HTH domain